MKEIAQEGAPRHFEVHQLMAMPAMLAKPAELDKDGRPKRANFSSLYRRASTFDPTLERLRVPVRVDIGHNGPPANLKGYWVTVRWDGNHYVDAGEANYWVTTRVWDDDEPERYALRCRHGGDPRGGWTRAHVLLWPSPELAARHGASVPFIDPADHCPTLHKGLSPIRLTDDPCQECDGSGLRKAGGVIATQASELAALRAENTKLRHALEVVIEMVRGEPEVIMQRVTERVTEQVTAR